jgi:hypothetical protein
VFTPIASLLAACGSTSARQRRRSKGNVVRDHSVPSLDGRYVHGDFCHPEINSVTLSPGKARSDHSTGVSVSSMSSFGQDTTGHVYALSLSGQIYRLAG